MNVTQDPVHRVRSALLRLATAIGLAVLVGSNGALAQVTTPAQGSAQRTAILNAVRGQAEAELGAPVEFVVDQMRVLGEWAFVQLHPQRLGGGTIFYTYTRYQADQDFGALDENVVALLRETPAGWLVYEYDFGSTDVPWYPWMDRYPVPSEVFPGGSPPAGPK